MGIGCPLEDSYIPLNLDQSSAEILADISGKILNEQKQSKFEEKRQFLR